MNSKPTQSDRPDYFFTSEHWRQMRRATRREIRQALLMGQVIAEMKEVVALARQTVKEWSGRPPRIKRVDYNFQSCVAEILAAQLGTVGHG
jgi:hypothetical protein